MIVGIMVGLGFLVASIFVIKSVLEKNFREHRAELTDSLKSATDSLNQQLNSGQGTINKSLESFRTDNHRQLTQMRQTVDEKLDATLNQRLADNAKQIDRRLEQVQKSFGEMQQLAVNVGDLHNTLTNVKTKGSWAEYHLENLLQAVLSVHQYEVQYSLTNNRQTVDFALKIPAGDNQILYLPIDAKFPLKPFEALQQAYDTRDDKQITATRKKLEQELKKQAKSIASKYVIPPVTTDFAIMYLPIESLYIEATSNGELIDELRDMKVAIAGPSTVLPMLSMLNMGYRSLMIQKNMSQAWQTIRQTQVEFGVFSDLLTKAQTKITQAGEVLEQAEKTTRKIGKNFRAIEQVEAEAPVQIETISPTAISSAEPQVINPNETVT